MTAVFAAHRHIGSAASFSAGYRPAMLVSAGISVLGALSAVAIGRRPVSAPSAEPSFAESGQPASARTPA